MDEDVDEAKPRGCSPEHGRRQRGDARVKESKRELKSKGRRCGLLRGCVLTFIGAGEAVAGQ
jgi:hypothetical protein